MNADGKQEKSLGCRLVSPEGCAIFIFLFLAVVFCFIALRPGLKDGSVIIVKDQRVLSEPLRYNMSQRIAILNLKAYLHLYPEIEYGDVVTIRGRVSLKKKTLEDTEVISLEKGGLNPIPRLLSALSLDQKRGFSFHFGKSLKKQARRMLLLLPV